MNTLEGTILIMNDGEEIFVEHTKEEINQAIDQAISVKRNYITITHLDRDIHFNYIKDKKRKVRYLAIEAPKKEFKEPTPEERKARDKMLSEMLKKTYDSRKKNFINERTKILKDLEKRELKFGLDSTVEKLNEYNKIKLNQCKNQNAKEH